MKKLLSILGLIGVIGIGSAFAYADSPIGSGFRFNDINNKEMQEWHEERMEWRKEDLKEGVEKGYITEEEAKTWEEHYNYMEEFHSKNGFRGCFGGRGMGMMRGRFGSGYNSKRSMMGW